MKQSKPRAGNQILNGIEIPLNVIIKKNNQGDDVYISGISDFITFRRIKDGSFYTVVFNQKIIDYFNRY